MNSKAPSFRTKRIKEIQIQWTGQAQTQRWTIINPSRIATIEGACYGSLPNAAVHSWPDTANLQTKSQRQWYRTWWKQTKYLRKNTAILVQPIRVTFQELKQVVFFYTLNNGSMRVTRTFQFMAEIFWFGICRIIHGMGCEISIQDNHCNAANNPRDEEISLGRSSSSCLFVMVIIDLIFLCCNFHLRILHTIYLLRQTLILFPICIQHWKLNACLSFWGTPHRSHHLSIISWTCSPIKDQATCSIVETKKSWPDFLIVGTSKDLCCLSISDAAWGGSHRSFEPGRNFILLIHKNPVRWIWPTLCHSLIGGHSKYQMYPAGHWMRTPNFAEVRLMHWTSCTFSGSHIIKKTSIWSGLVAPLEEHTRASKATIAKRCLRVYCSGLNKTFRYSSLESIDWRHGQIAFKLLMDSFWIYLVQVWLTNSAWFDSAFEEIHPFRFFHWILQVPLKT